MNSRFRLYGKEFIDWAKIEQAKNAARVSAREKTVCSPQDIQPRTAPDGRSTLIPSRKPVTGWQTHSTKTSTMFITPPPK